MFAYEQAAITLEVGDVLIAFTDGISEAMNESDEEWGEDRLIECLRPALDLGAPALIHHTISAVDTFVAGGQQHDDMTIIVARIV